jgi:polysaccharide export outer membrane protein
MIGKGVGAFLASWLLVSMAVAAEPAAAPVDAPPPQIVTNDYRIGPGDVLNVFVWRNPELTVTVPVRPDGKVSTPLVSDMVAQGKTPSQLSKDIETVLAEYVRSPQVNVIVTTPVSTFSQVKVVGQVKRPAAVPYREGMMLMDVMLQVGGVTEFAAPNRAKIVRPENGKDTEIKVRIGDLLKKGDTKQNIPVKPGDVIIVPESRF